MSEADGSGGEERRDPPSPPASPFDSLLCMLPSQPSTWRCRPHDRCLLRTQLSSAHASLLKSSDASVKRASTLRQYTGRTTKAAVSTPCNLARDTPLLRG